MDNGSIPPPLWTETKRQQAVIAEQQAVIAQLRARCDELSAKLGAALAERDAAAARAEAAAADRDKLSAQLDIVARRLDDMEENYRGQTRKTIDLRGRLAAAEAKLAAVPVADHGRN